MKVSKIFEIESLSISYELSDIYGFLDVFYNRDIEFNKHTQTRIKLNILIDYNFDDRRVWRLATLYIDNIPLAIIQRAGREGNDHEKCYILNKALFEICLLYLKSFDYSYNINKKLKPSYYNNKIELVYMNYDILNIVKFGTWIEVSESDEYRELWQHMNEHNYGTMYQL